MGGPRSRLGKDPQFRPVGSVGDEASSDHKNFLSQRTATAVLAGLASLSPLVAQAEGHYVPGVEGIQAASVPPPGFYYLGYAVNYNANSFRAPGSSTVSCTSRSSGRGREFAGIITCRRAIHGTCA